MKKILIGFFLLLLLRPAYSEPLLSLDFADANLYDVVRALSRTAGYSLVVSSDITVTPKRIYVHLDKTDPLSALDNILRVNGYSYQKRGKTIIISTLPKDSRDSAYQLETEKINLKFVPAAKLIPMLIKIYPEIAFAESNRANGLVVKGKREDLDKLHNLIVDLDKPVPLIVIESKVVELSESGMQDLGIKWGQETGGFKFVLNKETRKVSPVNDLIVTLDLLASQGKANIVASPQIATLDNHEAVINIGNKIPYAVPVTSASSATTWAVQYIDAGVSLKITPRLGEDGYLTVSLRPEISSVSEWRATPAGEFPVISTRNAEADLRVKDGETIIVGGLTSESERENVLKLPIAGDIPLLGLLFQNRVKERAKTEVIFLVTPHII